MSMSDPPLTGFSFEPLADLKCKTLPGYAGPVSALARPWRGTNCERPAAMARQRPKKKPDPAPPATRTVLPMQLQVADRFADETGEWEVVGRPYSTAGGKIVHARVQRI